MTPVLSREQLLDRLSRQHIETQSWGYVNTGTRFKVLTAPGAPRDVREKIDDAADPLRAFMASDERATRISQRVGVAAGW